MKKGYTQSPPTALVIFGAAGDLTHRKLIPALYNLHLDSLVPDQFVILGADQRDMDDAKYRQHLREGVEQYSRRKMQDDLWKPFEEHLVYLSVHPGNPKFYGDLVTRLDEFDRQWNTRASRIFYLAVPPVAVEDIAVNLGRVNLGKSDPRNRIVIEKPFGRDLDSARSLNAVLSSVFRENQIFRIDHYLGKETVQNILALRFANSLFEPIWNRRYIDHVQITVAEREGVEHRGAYYEQAGALRDMIQNHLSQILCLVAMEPPVSYQADEIRNKKTDVLHAIRPISPDQVSLFAVRGQYGAGWIEGQQCRAYRSEPSVRPDSTVPTFAAVKLFVDNWRWQDVPFYLRTGKRLPQRNSEIIIQFLPVPHQSFPASALAEPQPNRMIIRIQPEEGIIQRFQAKQPGEMIRLTPVDMRFSYREAFHTSPPEAYETLLLDVMRSDQTQFMRADQQEAAWSIVMPILEAWETNVPTDFPNYAAGTWGPEAAEVLIARDGRSWIAPGLND